MALESKAGRLSDIAESCRRADWSELRVKLKALEPGDVMTFFCPQGMRMASFRSTILTYGARLHKGDWALVTRSEGKKIHCFLGPRPGGAC